MTNHRLLRELADVLRAYEEECIDMKISMSIQFMTQRDQPIEPIFCWDGRDLVPLPKGAEVRY